ncbi:hypothetical protein HanXRQr2_Chr04g0180811 [Helianthus annuus]|uniref:Uncharacterized protein n=1 Tax=Helianthus annuus TaxID=4232 RepID=A0A9K3NTI3_HELAN|nr:hypothetical protein HanXRQr2_Chr04g0180811 [Helianthus annuus]KAJ0582036.1 hypothetical protein HanHA300_Chr04g0147821 [Helianthus annuus]KAJ0590173.1 hypothetical protein HanIR_Chr04g0194491 [Helianthus annuus]KAJ0598019.1 hypothetical protein HanHA89_Chr04g0161181 [Helianthus annuus]KAJ0758649.1 hypothetical protein HanLR1_Chr04g0152761 [Helianthus annuus]
MWPPTKQAKIVPLLKDLPDNSLHQFEFWMCDPVSDQAVIVCDNEEFRVADVRDLMRFGEANIHLLGRSQIQSDPQYEVCTKSYTAGVAQIILLKMWSGRRGWVETQLFGPYIGNKIPDA